VTLRNKTAIVTGASRGIGRAIAGKLANDGAAVVLAARDQHALDAAVAEIEAGGGRATAVALDLRLPDSAARLVAAARDRFRTIDIVINNAGATKRGEFLNLTDDDWADGFELKFFGAVRLTRAAWPFLKEQSGSVVNIAGIGGRTPGPHFALGGSVNAALLSLTKALADAGVADRIQVNAINPGSVRTARLARRLAADAERLGIDAAEAARHMVREAKTTRIGEPEDVANLVSFLVGPEGRWIHGSLIDIDGGETKTI
jgi:NAD(P)-dependent dehydrogenase (short-subunit alcohol dehydrogenase family)